MTYAGRAKKVKLTTKINGTHSLTFEMPDKFFDEKTGDFIHNEFVDALFNECKIKLHYKKKWYEFYIKNISDAKKFKSYIRTYTCSDVFIDELSRNGYGITFDEELYNNVEELGVFSEEILDDSTWEYDAHLNWGDFTEYSEEKLFKIPLSLFGNSLSAHKLNYEIDTQEKIYNIFTGETRAVEMGDDLARVEEDFWDQYENKNLLLAETVSIGNTDEYIYVPYSQLNFCYISTDIEEDNGLQEAFAATEEPGMYQDKGYAISPESVDPNHLIEFLYIPSGAKVEIDEAGLIVNKDFTYVMTVQEWNQQIQSSLFYYFEDYKENGFKVKKLVEKSEADVHDYIYGNWAAYYEGYVLKIGDLDVEKGKKISISDRTEINISSDIDQYVAVYNNKAAEYANLYDSEDWIFNEETDSNYRVCSKSDTRQIVPQLARNLVQNGTKINMTTGWEIMSSSVSSLKLQNAALSFGYTEIERYVEIPSEDYSVDMGGIDETYLIFTPGYTTKEQVLQKEIESLLKSISAYNKNGLVIPTTPLVNTQELTKFFLYSISYSSSTWRALSQNEKNIVSSVVGQINALVRQQYQDYLDGGTYVLEDEDLITEHNAVVNFGIIGQEKAIEKGKTYALGINIRPLSETSKKKVDEAVLSLNGQLSKAFIRIGNGQLVSDGDYQFKENQYIDFPLETLFSGTESGAQGYILFRAKRAFKNPYIAIYSSAAYELVELNLFEAYTKGIDQFSAEDSTFKYSGRDLFSTYTSINGDGYYYSAIHPYMKEELYKIILFEDVIMPGDTFSYNKYFIQQLKTNNNAYDTFKAKEYLSEDGFEDKLPLDASKYTEDDYKIITNYIDLNNCEYYNPAANATSYDCKCNSSDYDKICLYQKYGYCPYRFQTEKHCRKVRTLTGEKSNRFNLTQELGNVFNVYPVYWISHNENNGKILTQEEAYEAGYRSEITQGREDWADKRLFYITEKGKENKIGFRYEKNLNNISRTIASDKIVTKLYVLDTDSNLSKTGLCSIKTAEDNPSKDSFIIDFSYYIAQGILDEDKTMADLYGINNEDLGYLKTLGYYNTQYDRLSNLIINLSAASFTELQANLDVNLTGIETAQTKLRALEKKMSRYTVKTNNNNYTTNSTYLSYKTEYAEQYSILVQLIEDTFYTNGECIYGNKNDYPPANFLDNLSIDEIKEQWVDTHEYNYGILGQFNKEYNQIREWTKEQAKYLKKINQLSLNFYQKYEPYLKEGTWSDGNYLSDNAYYLDATHVAKEGAIPKVSYSITVADIEPLYLEGDYEVEVADTTYIEDIGMFGVNPKTGLPNRLKTLVSELVESPDTPEDNSIGIQDFTTQFEDLFQQVSATVQTLTFNEQIYKRSSNFTAQQNIKTDSLQGTLDENNLDLVNTQENNIQINWEGQSGSDINNHNNKYKLNGQGLFFSNNGGVSWNTAITPNGINADYLKAGTIDTSKIRLVDGKYIYFMWDNNGIRAYRDPHVVSSQQAFKDYAQFNKYGLSLVENGNIRLRAGYAFNSSDGSGAADKEQEVSGASPIGFYLYNSEGKAIFATENAKDNQALETARINLIGEILASNDATITDFYGYLYGGTCYTLTQIIVTNLGDDSNLITDITASISDNVATYQIPSTSFYTREDCAAYIAYANKNTNLQKIIIVEDNGEESVSYEYQNPVIITSSTNQNGQLISGSQKVFVNFDYCYVRYTNQPTRYFSIIKASNNKIVYRGGYSGSTWGTMAYTTGTATANSDKLLSLTSFTGINQSSTYTNSTYGYTYKKEVTVNNVYQLDNRYYSQYLDEQTTTAEGSVALYINNRNDLTSKASESSRLLVCCKGTGNSVSNIFSILKDGSLHMGGRIINQTSAVSLTDQIEISDEYLIIQPDGKLKMSFDDIVNINSNESIVSYISDQLRNATSGIMSEVNRAIYNSESGLIDRTHNHYIPQAEVGWTRPDSVIHLENIGDLNLSEITVDLNYHGQPLSQPIDLLTLLSAIGYYNTLYYGQINTDDAQI